jgi:hypothetical protein
MTLRSLTLAVALLVVIWMPHDLMAAEEPSHESHGEEGARHGEEGAHHGEHEFHRHHVSIFVGDSNERGEDAFTLGLDYEYRLSKLFGIGALVDFADEPLDTAVVGVPFFFHATPHLKLLVAPGLEHEHEGDEFLVRLGVIYDFEVGRYTISPAVNVDFVDEEEVWVYGLNFGRGF